MMPARIRVGVDRFLGPGEPTVVVAELGQNHNGCLALAEQLVDAAAWAGVDAVKFTKRDMDCELSTAARERPYSVAHSFGTTYGRHRLALELSADDYAVLTDRARSMGLLVFATACDLPSADLLAQLGVDVLKIASRDLVNLPLVEHAAGLDRPLFVSTGMSPFSEIDEAVSVLRRRQAEFVLLQCTSLYPTPWHDVHLRSIAALASRYSALVGFSDHTAGGLLAPVAVALGAVVIEKHLTLDRALKGTDHASSLEPEELRQTVENIRTVETALGSAAKPVPAAVAPVQAKLGRSLVTRVPLAAGTAIEEHMLTLKCPGDGISWLNRAQVLGRRVKRHVAADHVLSTDDLL